MGRIEISGRGISIPGWLAAVILAAILGLGGTVIVNSFAAWAQNVEDKNREQDQSIGELKRTQIDYARMDEKLSGLIKQVDNIDRKLDERRGGNPPRGQP
jgi:hypothetical protein